MNTRAIKEDVTILLVEDDEIDRMAFERFIRINNLPYKYIIATSVAEAEIVIEKGGFDIAIVDFLLGDGTGLDVVDKIVKVPVIFATGQGDQKIAVEAMKAGIYDYLVKDAERTYLEQLPVTIDNAISHRRAEERLREMEREVEKLLWVVSKTENSLVIANKNGKIEWVNEGFERLTGFNIGEVIETYGDMLLRNNLSGLNPRSTHYKTIMTDKRSVSYESKNYSKDGREFWVLTTITPILDGNNEIQKIIAIDSDITERKRVELELIQSKQRAEHLAKVKEEFLANMSHEIRTPMNAIIGMAELLSETKLDTKQKNYLSSIQFASENLLSLINDVLDLSKLDSGEMVFENVPFNIREQLESIVDMLQFKINEKKLELNCEIDKNVPEQLSGDPIKLNQVLLNLLSNAIKFTEKGHVSVKVKALDKNPDGKLNVRFEIMDSGIGIPENKHKQIFESFRQGQSETTRKYGGTGLGLTITKKLINLQGGEISLKSEVDKGTTFTVVLAYEVSDVKSDKKKTDSKPTLDYTQALKNTKVLVAEDNNLNQLLAVEFLNKAGARPDLASNGLEALEKVSNSDYDIVLMDIQMPEMDGYEAAKKIREKGNKIPIVAMTAHAFQGEKEKCLNVGMDDYLTKPIRFEKMVEVMSGLINKEKEE